MGKSEYSLIKEFWEHRKQSKSYCWKDWHDINCKLILPFVNKQSKVLDLGAGDCLLSDKLSSHVDSITAVDYVDFGVDNHAITFIKSNILDFQTDIKFNVILLFGVANYIKHDDMLLLYKKMYNWITDGGVALIKHQCGKDSDIEVDKYSEELQYRYIAYYRQYLIESKMMNDAGFDVEIADPYPSYFNKWPNMEFKLFIAKK